ncbi:PepSY domain-containing protein [Anaerococcus sp. Marseille-Q5996]|uniref:PepSY domain-containing protein n=1 Tax=Anaerococcus sp. Marseille-Q5996 TaxID=2972769 RepID=UPI0021C84431|nr:PepSY domain-containing protein [Anaerococcus sp. Marseille-Q5996]
MKFKNLKYGASALALAAILTACGGENAQQAKEDAKSAANNTEAAVTEEVDKAKDNVEEKIDDLKSGIEEKEFAISLDDAVAKFKEAFDDDSIEISSVELDEDDGKYTYDIEGFKENKEYEASIDAESGEVLAKEEENDDDMDDDIAIDFTKIISPKEAMAKALENNTGYVKSYEIDHDDDRIVYEIDIEDGDDVELDAESGDILHK